MKTRSRDVALSQKIGDFLFSLRVRSRRMSIINEAPIWVP